jgi:hypothetical protein
MGWHQKARLTPSLVEEIAQNAVHQENQTKILNTKYKLDEKNAGLYKLTTK